VEVSQKKPEITKNFSTEIKSPVLNKKKVAIGHPPIAPGPLYKKNLSVKSNASNF